MPNFFRKRFFVVLVLCVAALVLHALFHVGIGELSNSGPVGSLALGLATFYAWLDRELERQVAKPVLVVKLLNMFFMTFIFLANTICWVAAHIWYGI